MAQSISSSAVDEHRVPMPAHIAGQGKKKGATPEKQLNRFVRIVTFIERVGNALGTLAFTWATVVLLGGYPTVLCRGWFRDFWCATAIVFLEATREHFDLDAYASFISAAIARVVLALVRLVNNNEYYCDNTKDPIVTNPKPDDSQINLAPSLNIFYGMVLGQGALYVVACIFEIFAFIPRRSLARRSGFGGQWGMELVGLYYAYALEKSMEGDVLAPKNVNFNSFAMEYCLNSDKPNMQLHDGSSSTESERLPRRVAGQALAMLAMDNANNCLAMVREPEYGFIKKLTCMIHVDSLREVSTANPNPSYQFRTVLERIMVAEAAELEIFIGLSSQICQVIPGAFTRELEQGQIKGTFVKRLIDALNANMEPSADCPGIRRVILQQAISLMECDSRYANFFKDRGMKEALSMVEETASDVENYNLFLGDAGLIEASEPLPRLVARAKELLAVR
ncbi:hypothetical protein PR202_ga28964 [Eleusine coracana subsp. coracana]|uniref:Uncharacterized protein n=1 Tax=Eleusine coracana subsp. coracana TaxID=191504 RepID=A0AAV5DKG9_ELECO|nr:hypothetical protein PR202_ga28964 [Eleusine coracana subsp. coracana]